MTALHHGAGLQLGQPSTRILLYPGPLLDSQAPSEKCPPARQETSRQATGIGDSPSIPKSLLVEFNRLDYQIPSSTPG